MRTLHCESRVARFPDGRASAIWVTGPESKLLPGSANSQIIQGKNFLRPEPTAYLILKWCYRRAQVSIKSAPRTPSRYDSV
jgi:hypothetical protein